MAEWQERDLRFAIATVVQTWNSAPKQPGATMAVNELGEVAGSVSGGCVEGALYDLAHEVMDSGEAAIQRYGVSDDEAFGVGLTCGGTLDVLVQPADSNPFPELPHIIDAIRCNRPISVTTLLRGDDRIGRHLVTESDGIYGSLGNQSLDAAALPHIGGMLRQGKTGAVRIDCVDGNVREDIEIFVESFVPPPRMLVFGAIDFAGAVARIGKFLGYHVTVCDARPVFATRKRFPEADDVVVRWPHQYMTETTVDDRTVICVLTHDPKFDVPLLKVALTSPAKYVGVMGSRRTHEDRIQRLCDEGLTAEQLFRMSSPIGLDLGGRTAEETAVAIAAEIIALECGGSGERLSAIDSPIHR
ncbi:XdhC family protein [Rhodococcus jostii]|uniref:Xanthine dehydrogenase accessory factor n=1 Tax=Rhodococcus jostii TaxID=132919 RepID=A0A1H4ISG4_RHOJO|nr:XdhC/CoxI family protein [Rhodococcus jostii]SEB36933.1 xanthine dehydrogenase accessory factor [Rhodococcus jostii]